MGNTIENELVLKSVNQLFEYSFFIPAYQRGYRWSNRQVTQLLDDIWAFAKNPPVQEPGTEKPFYCLQPIVVKKHSYNKNEWEVIDGQQRLTTLYLIIKNLENQIERDQKNFTKIFYETRFSVENSISCEEFLKNVENMQQEQANQNIDFNHIWNAYQTIHKWFQEKANTTEDASPKAVFAPVLLRDTKIIWYEINEVENDPIDIFTRLNIGKIPLTNAELIKALFLQKGNFAKEKVSLKQIQIASEWDMIEKTLQDNDFWFFIYDPENPLKYDSRIEYIFDLMKGRTKDSEYYHTFNKFYEAFATYKGNMPDIDKIWLEIKRYFLTFEEWFKDYELFHYIGYLIDCGVLVNTIKRESENKAKDQFKEVYLKNEIKKQINYNIDEIDYRNGTKNIKKILLLFNIQTVLETQKSDMRFSFHKYKSENWDIEHICSQTDNNINKQKYSAWIDDILEYFVGNNDIVSVNDFVNNLNDSDKNENAIKDICVSLINLKKAENIEVSIFDSTFKKVQEYFKEGNQIEEKNDISNLALLDSTTNRSYKNAFFPIKRERIIENDRKGIFVPIATKNLFLKYYTKKLGEVMYWNADDAEDYLKAIKATLKDFLPLDKEVNDE